MLMRDRVTLMARQLKPEAITETDISLYLKDADDFQFEIDIFRVCQMNRFYASHGGIYFDPNLNKDRQYDIRAEARNGNCVVKLAVECKNLRSNNPLIVSRVPRLMIESTHAVVKSEEYISFTHNFDPGRSVLYRSSNPVGKSTVQLGRAANKDEWVTSDEEAYEKWTQAIASATELVREAGFEYTRTNIKPTYVFVQPVLVVADGTLWTADYTEDGTLIDKPRTTEVCDLYLGKKIGPFAPLNTQYTFTHLNIFTKTGFAAYLKEFGGFPDKWRDIFGNYYKSM